MYDVSVVIVCMNNLRNLYPCLDSINKYTHISFETLVVAYLFENENLEDLKNKYPWVTIVYSNEIRGFSENNNLAIKKARGKYCFILNDDTIFPMPVIDNLFESITKLPPDVAIISPVTYFIDNTIQSCGRPKHTIFTYILSTIGLWNEQKIKSKYTYQKGVFQTYDIVGAAFLIKTKILIELGLFDERYFFCPEDIVLSSLANKSGYKVYVDSEVKLFHIENGTASIMKTATAPASSKGELMYYSNSNLIVYSLLGIIVFTKEILKGIFFYIKYQLFKYVNDKIIFLTSFNVVKNIFTKKTPKQIFIFYYTKLKNEKKDNN